MPLLQRNRFTAQVKSVHAGSATHRIQVQVADLLIESIMTNDEAEKLHLKPGDAVVVGFKPTDVVLHRLRHPESAKSPKAHAA